MHVLLPRIVTHPNDLAQALAGRYQLERELGAGGMATVYLAQDLRHHRPVAIKVLHPELSAVLGPERFLKEIELTANLQHPNILPLFDSGAVGGLLFYVMPFVEGESLRARIAREHQLPVPDAVRIAEDVAAALEYAHRRGIVHRDIKPENILLHEGRPVVADFGIALAVQEAGGQRITQTGLSLGTPQYMSPEQAMGQRNIDARADVYALGSVLYEMLLGDPPFTGSSSQAVLARVLTEKPARIRTVRDTVPEHLEDAVLTSLAKLPADRFPSAAAFAAALGSQSVRRSTVVAPASRRANGLLLAALGVTAVVAAIGWLRPRPAPPGAAPSRLDVTLPPNTAIPSYSLVHILAMAPDGSGVAFSVDGEGGGQLLWRPLSGSGTIRIGENLTFYSIFFSPDGRSLLTGLGGNRYIWQPLDGGKATPLTVPESERIIPLPSGDILASTTPGDLIRVRPGQDSVTVVFPHDSVSGHWLQDVLPDGRLLLQRGARSQLGMPVDLVDLASNQTTRVLDNALEVRYAVGNLIYVLPTGQLVARPFDPARPTAGGTPVVLADSVAAVANFAHFDVSDNGTIAFVPVSAGELVRVDRSGAATPLLPGQRNYHSPRISPDGSRILVDFVTNGERDVWVIDSRQGTLTRATFTTNGHDGRWTPDGRAILFGSSHEGQGLSAYLAVPGGKASRAFGWSGLASVGEWIGSADKVVVTVEPNDQVEVDLRTGARTPLVDSRYSEKWGAASPDGRWLAWASDETGRFEVYVRLLSGESERVLVSTEGGNEVVWRRDGKAIFYRGRAGGHSSLIEAELSLGARPQVIRRTALFPEGTYATADPHSGYDVSPDGQWFVMVRNTGASRVTVIQNVAELVRRAGEKPR